MTLLSNKKKGLTSLSVSIQATGWILVLLALWELSSRLGWVPSYILPPLSKVFLALCSQLENGEVLALTVRSLGTLAEALLLSLGLAAIIIFISEKSRVFASFYETASTIMNSIPSMALLPLIIMWFGIDKLSILILVTHSILWTFTIYMSDGIKSTPRLYRDIAQNLQLSTRQTIIHILLPSLIPQLISGLKVAWSRAWRSLVGAEIVFGAIGSSAGLGFFINMNRLNGNMTNVLVGILVIILIGVLIDKLVFKSLGRVSRKWGM